MSPTVVSPARAALSKARAIAGKWMPYLTHGWGHMLTMVTEEPECKTLAVDKADNLYINPDFVVNLTAIELGYALLHETLHICLSHAKRFASMFPGGTEKQRYCWNIACDLVIQQLLARDHQHAEIAGIIKIRGCIPGTEIRFLDIPGLNFDMSPEQYHGLIWPLLPDEPVGTGGCLDPLDAGSNSDGVPRDYEKETTLADMGRVLKTIEKAKEEIENLSNPGDVAGNIKKSIDARLNKQPDWVPHLKNVVGSTTQSDAGEEVFSYRYLYRRQNPETPRKMGSIKLFPDVSIIIDTSGSMHGAEQKALTAIAQGMRHIPNPRVVCYDHKVQSAGNVSSLKDFEFVGYGGTSMEKAIELEDKEQSPDAIVLVTDGETAWPKRKPRAKLVVAFVKGSDRYLARIPSYARVIDCRKEAPSYAC